MMKQNTNNTTEHTCEGANCIHIPSNVRGDIIVSALVTSVLINVTVFVTWLVVTV